MGTHLIRRWLLPPALRAVWAGLHYLGFLRAGLTSLMRHRLDVPVLDATAIGLSFVKRDPKTAASTMFLLDLGEVLEDATRERSEHELIRSLMTIPQNARRLEDGEEVTVPAQSLCTGDLVVARTGMPVCVDGVVVRGAAMVNQAALTGEPLAVERMAGDDVFAGTAVEEGEIVIRVGAEPASTKLRSIVNLVEASEQLKSEIQTRREHLADRFVPWNFLLAGLVAVTAGCANVDVVGAFFIGLIAGILVDVAVEFIDKKLHIDDPVGAIAVHGVNGLWGTIAVGLFSCGINPVTDEAGNAVAMEEVHTAGKPHHIELSADRTRLTADGKDLAFIRVRIVDKKGNLCPTDDRQIRFNVTGVGFFRAAANGNSTSLELFHLPEMKLFSGQLTSIVQTTEEAGGIYLEASADGVESATIQLMSE